MNNREYEEFKNQITSEKLNLVCSDLEVVDKKIREYLNSRR